MFGGQVLVCETGRGDLTVMGVDCGLLQSMFGRRTYVERVRDGLNQRLAAAQGQAGPSDHSDYVGASVSMRVTLVIACVAYVVLVSAVQGKLRI